MKSTKQIKQIKTHTNKTGYRYVCPDCCGEVELRSKYCQWCGLSLMDQVYGYIYEQQK